MVIPVSPTFLFRHYDSARDLHPLSHLLTDIEAIDQDGEDTSEEYLRACLQWPNYRPDRDVWVAESEGALVGYAVALEQPSQRCMVYVVVHPSRRRNGLGSQLLDLVLQRARELGSKTILAYANERNAASNEFLKSCGFAPVGSSGTMRYSHGADHPSFELPAGFTIQPYSLINEPLVLLNALNDCYLDMWGHQHHEQFSEEELHSPRFLKYYNAEDILLLMDSEGAVAGICSVKSQGKRDENGSMVDLLDAPGVIKKYRQAGYQRQLVLAGLDHLRKMETHPILLEFWGESEQVLGLYRSLGFEMVNHYAAYHKELK